MDNILYMRSQVEPMRPEPEPKGYKFSVQR